MNTWKNTRKNSRPTIAAGLLVAASLALTGCGAPAGATDAAPAGASVTLADGWVKAADSGMSAAFGRLTNEGGEDATVVSASTAASTELELHETVANETGEMVMREVDGGFVVPAGGSRDLEPGGDHIMLMDLVEPLEAGDEVTFTLTFADGSTSEFTAPVKDYSGANENYVGGDDHGMEMDGMEMDGMETDG
ncbi:copper chaperone PCu(A)C [Promicromonospora citrea]|uniref:Copper(I)-binding protein n=1 Tax=Promicromonospora citrea TaxID=43677 RepID=A0A8H9GLM0_9MICO|nr:copper chaperone PCu(A)C [Promicromonospora citrea]NNH54313.1 copper chaperone PCu(A)C [Promicromonospora citrea]GGM38250.1 hypothetical protein GCM10010102_37270 [Promicromonospora citrea]